MTLIWAIYTKCIDWTKQNGLNLFLEPTVLVHVSNNIKYYLFIPAVTRLVTLIFSSLKSSLICCLMH